MNAAARRITAGEYEIQDGLGRVWTISRLSFGYGPEWLAACPEAQVALDPFPTLRRAKAAVAAITTA